MLFFSTKKNFTTIGILFNLYSALGNVYGMTEKELKELRDLIDGALKQ